MHNNETLYLEISREINDPWVRYSGPRVVPMLPCIENVLHLLPYRFENN